MSTPTDLAPTIETAAGNPLSVTSDGLSVTAQPIAGMIQADRYAAAKQARSTKGRGLMFSKLIPAAAFPDSQTKGIGGLTSFDNGVGGLL